MGAALRKSAAKPGAWGHILHFVGAKTISANAVRSGYTEKTQVN